MNSKKAINFLKNVNGKIGIFFHNDCDGCCSAAIVLAFLKQNKKNAELFAGDIDEENFKEFAKERVDTAIFLDFAVDQYPKFLEPFKNKNVLVIDHHPIQNDLNKFGFLYINPRFDNPSIYKSAAEACFEICKPNDFEWVMRVGGTGDRSLKGTEQEEEVAEKIDAVKAVKKEKGIIALARFLTTCKKIEDFLYIEEYQKMKELCDKEIEKQVKKFQVSGMEDINFFQIKSPYSITSAVAKRLFDMYPDKIIIAYSESKGFYKFSGRGKAKDIGSVFRKAAQGLGTGGGHAVAAGAKIPVQRFGEFRRRVISFVQK